MASSEVRGWRDRDAARFAGSAEGRRENVCLGASVFLRTSCFLRARCPGGWSSARFGEEGDAELNTCRLPAALILCSYPLLGITLLTSSAEERSSFLEKKGV